MSALHASRLLESLSAHDEGVRAALRSLRHVVQLQRSFAHPEVALGVAPFLSLKDVRSASLTSASAVQPWRRAFLRVFKRRLLARLAKLNLPPPAPHLFMLTGGFLASVLLDETWADADVDYVAHYPDLYGVVVEHLQNTNPTLCVVLPRAEFGPHQQEEDAAFLRIWHYNEKLAACKLRGFNAEGRDVHVDVICNAQETPQLDGQVLVFDLFRILSVFDFTCCMVAYDGRTLVVRHPHDFFSKRASFVASADSSLRALARLKKYGKRGFNFT